LSDLTFALRRAPAQLDDACLDGLADVLLGCVSGGASVSFVEPFTREDARRFFEQKVASSVASGDSDLLLAVVEGRIAGTVQLACDTPPNQPHRADVRKLLVHPDFRRRGIAEALMLGLEQLARERGRSLLTLDTRAGDSAERLYLRLGYQILGRIPAYANHPQSGEPEGCTFFFKVLEGV
jgi:ribosomal protein S18 acetylase RimI-like enzyme